MNILSLLFVLFIELLILAIFEKFLHSSPKPVTRRQRHLLNKFVINNKQLNKKTKTSETKLNT